MDQRHSNIFRNKVGSIVFIVLTGWAMSTCTTRSTTTEQLTISPSDSTPHTNEIWQLDYYSDSILFYKNITRYSKWSSPYAYNIEFFGSRDSCRFTGCHESWIQKLYQLNDSTHRSASDYDDHFELEFRSDQKLYLREFYKGKILGPYPYHRVTTVLTLDSLERRIAKELFAGQYELLFSDTLKCDGLITLDRQFGIKGIEGFLTYEIDAEDDWDTSLKIPFR